MVTIRDDRAHNGLYSGPQVFPLYHYCRVGVHLNKKSIGIIEGYVTPTMANQMVNEMEIAIISGMA